MANLSVASKTRCSLALGQVKYFYNKFQTSSFIAANRHICQLSSAAKPYCHVLHVSKMQFVKY